MESTSARFIIIFLLVFLTTSFILFYLKSSLTGNFLGLFSVISYVLTLVPSLIKTLLPRFKRHGLVIWLMKYRRQIGVSSFGFGAQHGLFIVIERSLDMSDMHTYIQYLHGSILFGIFFILTITSNNESVKWLKKRWKRIHQLTYFIPAILIWHVSDNMNVQTWITLVAQGLAFLTIALLTLRLFTMGYQQQEKKQKRRKKFSLEDLFSVLDESDRLESSREVFVNKSRK